MKMAASAAIRANIPNASACGKFPRKIRPGQCYGVAFIAISSLLVSPVRILRVLEIPERPAALTDGISAKLYVGGR